MPRLLFQKTGNAIWISHLDLMRLFQRAFKRAGLHLKHTQGFNPRPSVSIALPLSVGVESQCELLDFDLDGDGVPNDKIRTLLNDALVDGVRVLEVYDKGRKLRELSLLRCHLRLEYDRGVPDVVVNSIRELFAKTTLTVDKKTKSGLQGQDIIPMIQELDVTQENEHEIGINALICCQNPTLNPGQIIMAVKKYLPEIQPDYFRCFRIEVFDDEVNVFR